MCSGTVIITMRDVVRCQAALEATMLMALIEDEYEQDLKVQVRLHQLCISICGSLVFRLLMCVHKSCGISS